MIDKLELIAIKSILTNDPEYFHRKVCRYYSEKFHTPLVEVLNMPWAFVFSNYLEHILETNNTKENIYEIATEICYPNRKKEEEEEFEEWVREVEQRAEQEAKSNPQIKQKNNIENPQTPEKEIHMGEGVFDHLDEEMEDED